MGKGNRTRNNKYQDTYNMSGSGVAVKSGRAPQKKDNTANIVLAAIILLVVVSLLLVVFAGTGIKDRNTIVVSSDNYEVTGTMLTYFENAAYSNMFSQYFQLYYSYMYPNDINAAYAQAQSAMSQYTLDDFADPALATAKELLVLCEGAKSAGLTLDSEDETAIEETLAEYKGDFAGAFGTGIKEKDVRKSLELQTLASKYYDKYTEELEAAITDEEIQKYIADHKADFYAADYLKYSISLKATDYADATAFNEAKALADKYLALVTIANSPEEYKSQVVRYLIDRDFDTVVKKEVALSIMPAEDELEALKTEVIADILAVVVKGETAAPSNAETDLDKAMDTVTATLMATCSAAVKSMEGQQAYVESSDSEVTKWLLDESTGVNKTYPITDKATDEEYSKTVYMLTEKLHLVDEKTVNVGHILFAAQEGTAKEEDITKAEKEARDVLATYLAGEKTKEAFEKLGEEHTDDSSVFYENVVEGRMVTEFNDWIFDANRKAGDTDVIKTEHGFHVMYFDGKGDNTSIASAKNGIVSTKYEEFLKEGESKLTVNKKYIEKETEVETETEAAA